MQVEVLLFVNFSVNLVIKTVVKFLVIGEVLLIFIDRWLFLLDLFVSLFSFMLAKFLFYILPVQLIVQFRWLLEFFDCFC